MPIVIQKEGEDLIVKAITRQFEGGDAGTSVVLLRFDHEAQKLIINADAELSTGDGAFPRSVSTTIPLSEFTALSPATTAHSVNLGAVLPANARIVGAYAKVLQAFAAPNFGNIVFNVKVNGNSNFNVATATVTPSGPPSNTNVEGLEIPMTANDFRSILSGAQIVASVEGARDDFEPLDLSTLTAGSLKIVLFYETVSEE